MSATALSNFRHEMEEARFGRFHLLLGILLCLILAADGYDLYNAAYAAHFVAEQWRLGKAEVGLLLSSGLAGFAVGSLTHGPVADRFGRRPVMLAALWLAGVASLAVAVGADDFWSFCGLRIVLGYALGILMPLCTTYLNEFAPAYIANRYPLWFFGIGWTLGSAGAGLIGQWVVPAFGWQGLYVVGSGSFVLALAAHFYLPESVEFLALWRRRDEMVRVLARVRPERASAYARADFDEPSIHRQDVCISAFELLAPRYRRTSVLLWICGALSLFASYGLSGWLPSVMMQRGETLAASFLFGSLLMANNFVGTIGGAYLADFVGDRAKVLMVAWAIGALVILGLGANLSHDFNILFVSCAGIFLLAPQSLLNNLFAVSYDGRLRATGVGVALGFARCGAILGPFVAGAMQQVSGGGATAMFICLAAALALCSVVVASLNAGSGARQLPDDRKGPSS